MKKPLLLSLALAVFLPLVALLLNALGLKANYFSFAQNVALVLGWSLTLVGMGWVLQAVFQSKPKQTVYRALFLSLLGVAISSFSLTALIGAVVLFCWLDHRGYALNEEPS